MTNDRILSYPIMCHRLPASRQGRDWYIAQGGQGLAVEDDIDEDDNDFVYDERGL